MTGPHSLSETPRRRLTRLVAALAEEAGVEASDVWREHRGRRDVARVRQLAMWIWRYGGDQIRNFTEVGIAFRRDRTTVSHACTIMDNEYAITHDSERLTCVRHILGRVGVDL